MRIGKEAKTASDFKELEATFRTAIRDDLRILKAELGLATEKALWSKDIIYSTVAVAGAFIEPISALTSLGTGVGILGVIPLLNTRAEYRAARKQALQKHFTSWIYLARPSAPSRVIGDIRRAIARRP